MADLSLLNQEAGLKSKAMPWTATLKVLGLKHCILKIEITLTKCSALTRLKEYIPEV